MTLFKFLPLFTFALLASLCVTSTAYARFSQEEMNMMLYMQENDPLTYEQLRESVEKGLDPTASLPNQLTYLHMAARAGDIFSIRYLLEHGCDIEARDSLQRTPLMLACASAKPEVVEELIRHGAKMDAKGEYEQPLIFYACRNRDVRVLQLLLTKGQKLTDIRPCFYYANAFELACDCYNIPIARYLIEQGEVKDLDAALFIVSLKYKEPLFELTELLLDKGASSNARASNARAGYYEQQPPILSAVCSSGNVKTAELLLSRGAKIDAQDDALDTALHEACSGNHENPCVDLLLKHGAKIDLANKRGYTALDIAIINKRNETVRLLQAAGAK